MVICLSNTPEHPSSQSIIHHFTGTTVDFLFCGPAIYHLILGTWVSRKLAECAQRGQKLYALADEITACQIDHDILPYATLLSNHSLAELINQQPCSGFWKLKQKP